MTLHVSGEKGVMVTTIVKTNQTRSIVKVISFHLIVL